MSNLDMTTDEEIERAEFEADEKARISALHKSAPEKIWLQIDPEAEQFDAWDAQTWCSDQINDTDLQYVRADCIVKLERQRDELLAALTKAREDINWMLNNEKFLNGFVFDYINAAIDSVKGQQ